MDEQEIPKYKHQYKECLIQYPISFAGKDRIQTHLCSYCIICGKIGDRVKDSIVKDYVKPELYGRGTSYSVMSGTELYEEYHNKMPVFFVKDMFEDKYIQINKEINNE